MRNRFAFLIFSLWITVFNYAQNSSVVFSIKPVYNLQTVFLKDSAFVSNDGNSLQIDVLKFYISHIQLFKNGNLVAKENASFHLIDASGSCAFNLDLSNHETLVYDELRFCLGIDSLTNNSGAFGGPLDPTLGMYWTWQSGYINFKLEGKNPICQTRNHEFVFHLGGFKYPYNAMQNVSLALQSKGDINLSFDLAKLIGLIDLQSKNHIMSPGSDGLEISKIAASCFKVLEN